MVKKGLALNLHTVFMSSPRIQSLTSVSTMFADIYNHASCTPFPLYTVSSPDRDTNVKHVNHIKYGGMLVVVIYKGYGQNARVIYRFPGLNILEIEKTKGLWLNMGVLSSHMSVKERAKSGYK